MKDAHQNGGKIVPLRDDGLGGLPLEPSGKTELETAVTPQPDRMALRNHRPSMACARRHRTGERSGPSEPFSYDPVRHEIGRGRAGSDGGGIGFELTLNDSPWQFWVDRKSSGRATVDRRAGRINTDECIRLLAAKLQAATQDILPGYEVFVRPVEEHRLVLAGSVVPAWA